MSGNWDTIRALEAQRSMEETLRRIYHEVYDQDAYYQDNAEQEPVSLCCINDTDGVR